MIRYDVTRAELEAAIDTVAPKTARRESWRTRAASVTANSKRAKKYVGPDLWSEIKRVYMDLQRFKCAYCECAMPTSETAAVVWDVEHFRPKNAVTDWPSAELRKSLRIRYRVGAGTPSGYYMLAHEIENYAGVCKECNSPLKSDHFPIGGKAGKPGAESIDDLNARERPLLMYPIGRRDDDPKTVLTFRGVMPVPVTKRGTAYLRARVCIDFFRLHTRSDLIKARAFMINTLWVELERERTGSQAEKAGARKMIDAFVSDDAPQAACARAFEAEFRANRGQAEKFWQEARKILQAKEPSLFKRP